MKLILLNQETNETVCAVPHFVQANLESSPRHLQLVLDFHGMPHEDFNKLVNIVANAF
jgi:hypothetical protein